MFPGARHNSPLLGIATELDNLSIDERDLPKGEMEMGQCGMCGENRKMKYWDICYECDQDLIDEYQNGAYSSTA
jgi:hypothetical protein